MNILLISYGDYEYDGRLRELVNTFNELGDLHFYSMSSSKEKLKNQGVFRGGNYLKFILQAVKYGIKFSNIDVIVLDNRKAIIPGRIIKAIKRINKIILDCRELYFINEVDKISSKIGCLLEKPCIKNADIVISANMERAEVMKEKYGLKETPIVFENIRALSYSTKFDASRMEEKYKDLFNQEEIRIVATAGCNVDRMNDILVQNINRVTKKCRLFLIGGNEKKDEECIEQIIRDNQLDNVHIMGKMNQDELKYFINQCHIGIVNYNQKDFNNKYCASGKIFEFLFEGVPVVTTTNPPLVRLCMEYGVGESDDSFANAINTVSENYTKYKNNAMIFGTKKTVDDNNRNLKREISKRLGQ